jgi:hypothetical protein
VSTISPEQHRDLISIPLHCLYLERLTAETIVQFDNGTLHLVRRYERRDDEMAEYLYLACGGELVSDIELPVANARRAAWQTADEAGLPRCSGCAPHAGEFPEAQERPGDETMPDVVAASIEQAVDARHAQVGGEWLDALRDELATRALQRGPELLAPILMRHYETLVEQFGRTAVEHALSFELWREVVNTAVEEILEDGPHAQPQTWVYLELREQLSAVLRPAAA